MDLNCIFSSPYYEVSYDRMMREQSIEQRVKEVAMAYFRYSGIFLAILRIARHVSQVSWYLNPNLNI
jgi:hypothetical protein